MFNEMLTMGSGGGSSATINVVDVPSVYEDGGTHNISQPSGIVATANNIVIIYAFSTTYHMSCIGTIVNGSLDATGTYSGGITPSVDSAGNVSIKFGANYADLTKVIIMEIS